LKEISEICKEFSIWLHVDAALGGSVLLSRKHRHHMTGIENADSIAWNPHKAMTVPLQCSAFLVREKGIMHQCLSSSAEYLFQPDKLYGEYDVGDKSIQCGRKPDAFKLWLTWKALGVTGYENHMDKIYDNAEYLKSIIRQSKNFVLVIDTTESFNVCFWFIPVWLSTMLEKSGETPFTLNKKSGNGLLLHNLTAAIKADMQRRGRLMVACQPMESIPNFFKVCVTTSHATKTDFDFILQEIQTIGDSLPPADFQKQQ